MKKLIFLLITVFVIVSCEKTENSANNEKAEPIAFTVIGDVPYGDTQLEGLIGLIEKHNGQDSSEFVVHVGDIKKGSEPCDENVYKEVSTLLKTINTPTFIILGDNEYNDCENPDQALQFWNTHFLKFNENWNFPFPINYQNNRIENFSWVQNKILFVGLNIVGSSVHDENEWETRLTDNGTWVKQLIATHKNNIEATVLFSHANMVEAGANKFKIFTDLLIEAATDFAKPVLVINGDGHFWIKNNPWPSKNITRVQITGGADALKVTINTDMENPFSFDNTFLD